MTSKQHLVLAEDPKSSPGASSGNGSGNGGLINHRLKELERRMDSVEGKIDNLNTTTTEIKTKLENLASKNFVSTTLVVTVILIILSLVGHIFLNSMGS